MPVLLRTGVVREKAPTAIPTFHCLGLYWSPPGGAAGRDVQVRYRRQGDSQWKEALPMRYNPIPGTDEDLADYRGSIVNLRPATTYDIQLTLRAANREQGTPTTATLTARTWSEDFPVGQTVRVTDRDTPLQIKESGSPGAYRLYDGRGATIDVRHKHDQCIMIDASYVIVRGLTLKGAGAGRARQGEAHRCHRSWRRTRHRHRGLRHFRLGPARSGDRLRPRLRGRHSVAEPDPGAPHRPAVQDPPPALDGSPWDERYRNHTKGPQCISLFDTAGNHVIRYYECFSDLDHMYNDVIGGGSNGSFRGSPGKDSDIYGNIVSHCWDDGLEVEGGSRNVRVWGNYITQTLMSIGNAPCSIGPLYIWGNVVGCVQRDRDAVGGNFLKMGFADGEGWMTGHMYIFHNTIFHHDAGIRAADWAATASSNTSSRGTTSSRSARPETTARVRTRRTSTTTSTTISTTGGCPKTRNRTACAASRSMSRVRDSIRRPTPADSHSPPTVRASAPPCRSPISPTITRARLPTSVPTNAARRRSDSA